MQIITTVKSILMAVALLSIVLLSADEAAAQTATNVNCNGCVNTKDIANDAVNAKKIRDKAVGIAHLNNGAKPAGADFTEPVDAGDPATNTVITSLTMDLPGPGVVILNSGGYVVFNDNPSSVVCSITKTNTTAGEPIVISQNHNVANARRMPVATTRGFQETAGIQTYNFVCISAVGTVALNDIILTAVFAPQRY